MNFACDVCGREVLSCTFVNGMNFTCDVCGREVFTCIFVNGMKFCAKCYQETFGETDKDRKIADLEAKLAESEKKAYSRGHSQRDIANEIKLNALREDVANKEKRIVELKQQLEEKEKERHEEWKTGKEWKWEWQKVDQKLGKADEDKISFAVEQLEKAKSFCISAEDNGWCVTHKNWLEIVEYIDSQIKQLNEGK